LLLAAEAVVSSCRARQLVLAEKCAHEIPASLSLGHDLRLGEAKTRFHASRSILRRVMRNPLSAGSADRR